MSKAAKIIGGIVIIVLVIWGVAESKKDHTKTGNLDIGVISSLTGNAAYIGESNMKGAEVGKVKVQNEHPGLNINIFNEDSALNPQTGVAAYNKLRNLNKINALITQASNVSVAVAPLAIIDNVLFVAASTFATSFSTPDDLTFRTTASSDIEAIRAIEYLESKKLSKLGIIYINAEFGITLRDSLKKATNDSSVKVVAEEGYAADTTDFKTFVLKMKGAGVDSVYVAGLAPHTANMLKLANELSLQVPFLSYRAAEDPVLLQVAGSLAENLFYTNSYDASENSSMNNEFVKLYKEKYGTEPNGYAAEAYEAVRLIADTYAECGSTVDNSEAQQCAKDFLFSIKNQPSLFGPLSFDNNGDVTYPFFIKTVRDGKFVRLEE